MYNIMQLTASLLVLFVFVSSAQSARILGFFPFPGKSHFSLAQALLKALAEKGHDVTVVSAFHDKNTPKNYRTIVLDEIILEMDKKRKDINMFEIGDMHPLIMVPTMAFLLAQSAAIGLKEPKFQELLHDSNKKFDVVIVEQFFNDAHKVLGKHFNAPVVLFSSVGANAWTNDKVGNPANPSYVSDSLLDYTGRLSFKERLINTLVYCSNVLVAHLYSYPMQNRVIQEYIPNAPSLYDSLYNSSIVLLNSHASFSDPVPHVPSMIEVGGLHIKTPKKLPDDIQKYLDQATDGVIFFSLGSNLKSADLPPAKREAFINAFAKLKQKVLWKWEEDALPGKSENVRISSWWPQSDILAHPNIRLFITHGGLLSTTEAVARGVPVLAVPIYGDQKLNAQRAVRYGFGLNLPYQELTEETLSTAIKTIIDNPRFSENAKQRSKIFHDRENKPLDTATYWVEYVIRHGGAPHLRIAGADMPWYQYLLIDVIVVIVVVVVLIFLFIWWIIKVVHMKLYSKRLDTSRKNK